MKENPVFVLLQGLVDYAGLFPPARLRMNRVVHNFQDYRLSPQNWMLGRLIVPVTRLTEFEEVAGGLLPRSNSAAGWQISCLLPARDANSKLDLRGAMREIQAFNLRHATSELGFARIDTVELRHSPHESPQQLLESLAPQLSAYIELAIDEQLEQNIEAIARCNKERLHAKIRTGGITEDLIPSAESVIRFASCCIANQLAFKATAGLHHPIRARYALTYERNPEFAMMHGFLNLLLATGGLLTGQLDETEATTLLRELDPATVSCSSTCWRWDKLVITADDARSVRQRGLRSFGSCSFIEPVEDLQAMGCGVSLTSSP